MGNNLTFNHSTAQEAAHKTVKDVVLKGLLTFQTTRLIGLGKGAAQKIKSLSLQYNNRHSVSRERTEAETAKVDR